MSHNPEDCLSHIIGLSQTTCDCHGEGKPTDANESDSGLYLDEIEGLPLNLADSASDCDNGSVWDLLSKARTNAILAFKSELMAAMKQKYKQKRSEFNGIIGDTKFKNSITLNSSFGGSRIYCANIISGVMNLKRIGLAFDTTAVFNVEIYNNVDDSPIYTYEVESLQNKVKWFDLPVPINLPMNEDSGTNVEYYLVYSVTGKKPKDVRGGCGCGGGIYKYYWDTTNPLFRSYERGRWSEYIMYTGIQGDDIADRENWGTNEYLNGILLDASFTCKTSDLICKNIIDYESNEVALVMAYSVRYRAASLVVDNILSSGNINRYTMMDREALIIKRSNYLKEYQNRISYLADNINWKANDCLTCNDFNDIVKVGILS